MARKTKTTKRARRRTQTIASTPPEVAFNYQT
jgi:hypothetical protein